ncbi:MAG: hypothetical protein EZS28_025795 [Streblomastix strix]|uniref:Uncharacterized protein n=1 Tax=Streblomastix strix TaxID=222440 RepID=A0A5J4V7M2_9EUKA|nr:MAG: hypothetical protein EZS28_025795 [Streblomastix strix]
MNAFLGVKTKLQTYQVDYQEYETIKFKEKIFPLTYLQMNLNQTIDLFLQLFNNLLQRFLLIIRGHWKIAIDALNQVWMKEFPWIHPPISLPAAVLKKIREERIRTILIAPPWPGQILYTELVNVNDQSLMLGWMSKILELVLKNNHTLQFTRKAISAHKIVKTKQQETQNVETLFDYWREKGSNGNLTNVELQTKLVALLMTICSMRPGEIERVSIIHSMIREKIDSVDL